ncbi:PLD nuclease N-terminal domain-containing protein [Saccharopolyspora hirsuta]|uniref:PLDc_N domain-containing protein n=1 Tax=Saccharopolyspora hirsuta TaxID=1837 RepID=A0A5M7BL88_SACHI|nr:PLD nuclease N-terminal domain-containing protein [Saccharopolyspora hirsuta]KAA5830532.1 PLDc_N domain-containing protein [Saccharopolyspora hirsuta]
MHALVQQASLAAETGGFESGMFLLLAAIPLLAYAALVIGAVISVLGSEHTFGMKVVWIIFVCVAPFLGSILWFLVGRSNARRTA